MPEQLTGERDFLFTALSLAQHPKKASCATFPLHAACNTDGHCSSLPGQSRNRISHWQKHMPLCISQQNSPEIPNMSKIHPPKNTPPTTCREKPKPSIIPRNSQAAYKDLTQVHQTKIPCWELLARLEVSIFLPSVQCCISDDNLRIICLQLADSRDEQFAISSTYLHNNITKRSPNMGSVWLSTKFPFKT